MKYKKNVYQSLALITQFGIHMIVPILMCTMLGVYIGKKYDMLLIVAPLFVIGALAGFRNIYRLAKKYMNRKVTGIPEMLRRLNKALPELVMGIILYGIAAQSVGIWLTEQKAMYSAGLWLGILLAVGMAIHMAVVIEDAVSAQSGRGKLITMSLLRYFAVAAAFLVISYFKLGNPIAAFVGVMGLKIAAYMQPLLHKVMIRFQRKEGEPETFESGKIEEQE